MHAGGMLLLCQAITSWRLPMYGGVQAHGKLAVLPRHLFCLVGRLVALALLETCSSVSLGVCDRLREG